MKRHIQTLFTAFAALLLVGAAGCADNAKSGSADTKQTTKKTAVKNNAADLPNYRYVDIDTVLSRYNLAKDYNEQMLRLQNSLQSKEQQHKNRIGSFAQNMESKYRNNGYLSEASFNQDQQQLANMQASAERELGKSAEAAMKQQAAAEKEVQDSIKAFIDVYMTTHKYDAIFFKNATLYINPALDITDEIVEGLNARYNKKKK